MTPAEVPGTSARSFYRQELMLSTVQDTSPMVRVNLKGMKLVVVHPLIFDLNSGCYRW